MTDLPDHEGQNCGIEYHVCLQIVVKKQGEMRRGLFKDILEIGARL
jgi:hypothetical protein